MKNTTAQAYKSASLSLERAVAKLPTKITLSNVLFYLKSIVLFIEEVREIISKLKAQTNGEL